jgi:uracil-DNA glycosylase
LEKCDEMRGIDQLVEKLARRKSEPLLANPYGSDDPEHDLRGGAEIRRANLRRYLNELHARGINLIIVGEAAGYQGCRFSGIAFTSEFTLQNHAFFKDKGYQRSAVRERLWKEPSGSIIWETAGLLGTIPLLWNIVPFHPHAAGNALSNRTPVRAERDEGIGFLLELLKLFPGAQIVTAGRIAGEHLAAAEIPHTPVRHPAYGGKAEFQSGVRAVAPLLKGGPA